MVADSPVQPREGFSPSTEYLNGHLVYSIAPPSGFEPETFALTVHCSAVELWRNVGLSREQPPTLVH